MSALTTAGEKKAKKLAKIGEFHFQEMTMAQLSEYADDETLTNFGGDCMTVYLYVTSDEFNPKPPEETTRQDIANLAYFVCELKHAPCEAYELLHAGDILADMVERIRKEVS